jgi:hypothetical protein
MRSLLDSLMSRPIRRAIFLRAFLAWGQQRLDHARAAVIKGTGEPFPAKRSFFVALAKGLQSTLFLPLPAGTPRIFRSFCPSQCMS